MFPTSKYTPFATLSIAIRYFYNSKSGFSFRFNGMEKDSKSIQKSKEEMVGVNKIIK